MSHSLLDALLAPWLAGLFAALLAALSAMSCELDLLPDLLATLGDGEPTGEESDAAELQPLAEQAEERRLPLALP